MSFKVWHLHFIASLRGGMSKIQEELGADWPLFSDALLVLVGRLIRAADAAVAESIVDELIAHATTVSERCEYIDQLLVKTRPAYRGGGPGWGSESRPSNDRVWRNTYFDSIPLPAAPKPAGRGADDKSVDHADITTVSLALVNDLKADKLQKERQEGGQEAEKKPRYFNTFFTETDSGTIIPDHQALLQKKSYKLYVEINPERKGPGGDDIFVDNAVSDAQKSGDSISLLVVAASHDFEIKPGVDKIDLPPEGPSTKARFSVCPLVSGTRGVLQVEIFYRGHLLQAKRLEALVVTDPDFELPISLRPAQSARLTFTTTERFSADTLALMPERVLTIDVERDERDQSVDLRFLDRTNGEEELACYDTTLQPQALGEAVSAVREQLKAAIKGEERNGQQLDGYEWKINGSDAILAAWLPYLADAGRNLYRALLPESQRKSFEDQGEKLKAALQPGAAIQINPIVGKVTIPWALLYERPVLIIPGETRICEKYWTAGPNCPQCESLIDSTVICPSAFWGYRYAIEQLPCWVGSELPKPIVLLHRISNAKPLLLNLNVWQKFNFWQDHIKKLEAAGTITTLLAEDLKAVRQTWLQRSEDLDVLYFYTHGGIDKRQPYLEVSDGRIVSNFLEATLPNLPHNPLVFLNGCSTGDYGPESFVSLIDDFRKAGAAGVIGTECAIPELFAEAYATLLFPRLFRGERLGQAMLELRREFLLQHKNPLALVYSLYASNEISLASPVNVN